MNAKRVVRAILLFAAAMVVSGLAIFGQAPNSKLTNQAKQIEFVLSVVTDPAYKRDFEFQTNIGEGGAYAIYRVGKEHWTIYYTPTSSSPGHIQFSMVSPGMPRQDVFVGMNGKANYGKVVTPNLAKQMLFIPNQNPPVGLEYRQFWQTRGEAAVAKAYIFTQRCQNRHCGLVERR